MFSRQIDDLLSPEGQRELQLHIQHQPDDGDLIRGSGGLRKLRWSGSGRGKRGGIRVIYYLWHENTALMLAAYPKNVQTDLPPAQLKLLKITLEAIIP